MKRTHRKSFRPYRPGEYEPPVTRQCRCCGGSFETAAYLVKKGKGSYCSVACGTHAARDANREGHKKRARARVSAPFWLDGVLACQVRLSTGDVALIDAEDAPLVRDTCWQLSKGYANSALRKRMHTLILPLAGGLEVDHINRNRLDNRKSNLRPATNSQNGQNRLIDSSATKSGVLGVSCRNGRYQARVKFNRRQIHLGTFDTIEAAAAVARDARGRLFTHAPQSPGRTGATG